MYHLLLQLTLLLKYRRGMIYYTRHYTYFYILALQQWAKCPVLFFFPSSSLSLKGSPAAGGFAATRGRRRLFPLLALLLPLRLIRQKAGKRLCSGDKSHCQAGACREKKWRREESIEPLFLFLLIIFNVIETTCPVFFPQHPRGITVA